MLMIPPSHQLIDDSKDLERRKREKTLMEIRVFK
jgi:hypothetical protein